MSMYVKTVNRLEPAWPAELASRVGSQPSLSLVTNVTSPGTAYQNASYGMAGLGNTFDDSVNAILPVSVAPYFTSDNYYLGFIGLAAIGFLLTSKGNSGRKAMAGVRRKANLKGQIAREQALLGG